LLGIWLRWAALGSSILLLLFGTAMAISFGIKSPLDYSVFPRRRERLSLRSTRRESERLFSSEDLRTDAIGRSR